MYVIRYNSLFLNHTNQRITIGEGQAADLYPGVLHYIEEVVLRPTPEERSLEPALADRIIHLLGANSLPTLLNLILSSPTFRFLPNCWASKF